MLERKDFKGVLVLLAVLAFFPGAARAQDDDDFEFNLAVANVLESERKDSVALGVAYGEAVKGQQDFAKQLADERKAFWDAYPNGANIAELNAQYQSTLNSKDLYYLLVKDAGQLVDGGEDTPNVMDPSSANHPTSLPEAIDAMSGGMEPVSLLAEPAYKKWVKAIKRKLGPLGVLNFAGYPDALAGTQTEHRNYVDRRNLAEFLTDCHTSPMRSTDPRQYFAFIVLVDGQAHSPAAADKLYDQLSAAVSPEILNSAVNQVRLKYDTSNDAQKFLTAGSFGPQVNQLIGAGLNQSSDDRLFLLANLYPIDGTTEDKYVDNWIAAGKAYDALVARDGASKVRAETEEWRQFVKDVYAQIHPDPGEDPRTLLTFSQRAALTQKYQELFHPISAPPPSGLQVVFDIGSQKVQPGETPRGFGQLQEGPDGSIFAMQGGERQGYTDQVVRLDPGTGQVSVLVVADHQLLPGPGSVDSTSFKVNGGWLYIVGGFNLVRAREDGSNVEKLDTFSDHTLLAEPPKLLGFDAGGNALVSYRVEPYNHPNGIYRETGTARQLIAKIHPLANGGPQDYFIRDNHLYFFNCDNLRNYTILSLDLATGKTSPICQLPKMVFQNAGLKPAQNGGIYFFAWLRDHVSPYGIYWMQKDGSGLRLLHQFNLADATIIGQKLLVFHQAKDGYFYAVGPTDSGKVQILYRMNPDGTGFGPFYEYKNRETIGVQAGGELDALSDGCLYGSTWQGGKTSIGSIYKILPDPNAPAFNPPDNGVPAAVAAPTSVAPVAVTSSLAPQPTSGAITPPQTTSAPTPGGDTSLKRKYGVTSGDANLDSRILRDCPKAPDDLGPDDLAHALIERQMWGILHSGSIGDAEKNQLEHYCAMLEK